MGKRRRGELARGAENRFECGWSDGFVTMRRIAEHTSSVGGSSRRLLVSVMSFAMNSNGFVWVFSLLLLELGQQIKSCKSSRANFQHSSMKVSISEAFLNRRTIPANAEHSTALIVRHVSASNASSLHLSFHRATSDITWQTTSESNCRGSKSN